MVQFFYIIKIFGIFLFFGGLTAIAGLQHFALTLPKDTKIKQITDGLIVTTGGQARIEKGAQLIARGQAKRMLITGVGKGISKQMLSHNLSSEARDMLICCADLDAVAMDTIGNAHAAKQWAIKHKLASLTLVTADYHMPRAYLLFKKTMPERLIIPHPVITHDLGRDEWYKTAAAVKLFGREYLKYLYVRLFELF